MRGGRKPAAHLMRLVVHRGDREVLSLVGVKEDDPGITNAGNLDM